MKIEIFKMSYELLKNNINRICEIEESVGNESNGTYRNIWKKENFLLDLPGKWIYSRVLYENRDIVGFYIASQKKTIDGRNYLHGHRVAFIKSVRSPFLILRVYEDMFKEARTNGLKWFTGYQMTFYPTMLIWYQRVMQVEILKNKKEIEYFTGKLPKNIFITKDGKIFDKDSGLESYFITKNL